MPTPFPGMNPYLEHPTLWHDVHFGMIASIRDASVPLLRPRYRVLVEERTYRVRTDKLTFIGMPDVLAVRISEAALDLRCVRTSTNGSMYQRARPIKEGYLVLQ